MKTAFLLLITLAATVVCQPALAQDTQLRVVTTLPDYAVLAEAIGGDRVTVEAIVQGEQDAHYIRPRPSFVDMVREADVLIDTGLDLEMWIPTVIDRAGNPRVRSGQPGYVAVAQGMRMLERPQVISRAEGGVHVYGNPHVTCSPVNMRVVARNISTGLSRNDPAGADTYAAAAEAFVHELDVRLFGDKLVDMLGGDTLCALSDRGRLISFLEDNAYEGTNLIEHLDGWVGEMFPLRGTPIVTYHKNWVYFVDLFGLEEAGTVEPNPGIPPSPRHVLALSEMMEQRNIRIVLAANYFDEQKVHAVADTVSASAVIVPLYVGGEEGIGDYFQLVDLWVNALLQAAEQQGLTR